MSRPGYVHDVEHSTPPVLFWRGEQLAREPLPVGARTIYAPEPYAAISDPDRAVEEAISHPVSGAPLRELLAKATTLTIAVDDVTTPTPPMHMPDNRQRVVEAVLGIALDAGIEDVEIVIARGLRRRLSDAEVRHMLGYRVYESFGIRSLLTHHDAEDTNGLTEIATTASGDAVAINKRVASSDVVVHVGIMQTAADGGWAGFLAGLGSYNTIESLSLAGAIDEAMAAQVGAQISQHVAVVQIQTTLNNHVFAGQLAFAQKREWEWSLTDKAAFRGFKALTDSVPAQVSRTLLARYNAPHGLAGVFVGDVVAATAVANADLYERQVVNIDRQCDVLAVGVSPFGAYSVDSIMNPILATEAATSILRTTQTQSLVRKGGALIVHHSMRPTFDSVRHPSYADFFAEVLVESTDPAIINPKYQERFANDAWFRHLYSSVEGFHGAHPFRIWNRSMHALRDIAGVIVVGGDPDTVRRLGFKPASTFQDALEMSRDVTGQRDPAVVHAHTGASIIADVRG